MRIRGKKKVREGVVVHAAKDKTSMVKVDRTEMHPLYARVVRYSRRYMIHDEKNECAEGDRVEIMETRPLSKRKRWRLLRILEKAK